MKLNPNAVVPTLVHDGKVIIESTVIMHYVDEVFPARRCCRPIPSGEAHAPTTKLMDEYVHVSCMTITFATANRASLARLTPQEMEAELAKAPDPETLGDQAPGGRPGLDAPPVIEALRQQERLLDAIESRRRMRPISPGQAGRWRTRRRRPMSGGSTSSSSRACGRAGPASACWYDRMRAALVQDRGRGLMTPADHERYAKEPDPWPKVRELAQGGVNVKADTIASARRFTPPDGRAAAGRSR